MASSNKTSISLNIRQNQPDFQLEDLEDSPTIFREKLFSKVLDPEKLENFQTVTIKYLQKGCS